ncbi:family S53 protease-like protein [Mycena galericulata]|nr:family S53 protease-like protein [Mycena galericulata]
MALQVPKLLVSLFSIFAAASAAPSRNMVVLEQRTTVPSGFFSQGAAPADYILSLRVGLAANNLAGLEARLTSLSTPGSPEFRQWLSKDEVKAFTQPSSETVTAFNAFASANGLNASVISPNGDWLALTLPVSQANDLFDAQFEFFTHPSMESAIARTLSISLPSELVGHIDVIHPSTEFTRPKFSLPRTSPDSGMQLAKRQASSCNTSNGNGLITPACLQALYGIPTAPATHSTLSTNSIIVPEYSNEAAQTEYLADFLTQFRPDIPLNTTFTVLSVDGGVNNQTNDTNQPQVEANLDIQYTVGIATGVPVQLLAVGNIGGNDNTTFDPFPTAILDTTTYLLGVENPPTVMTTSYSEVEGAFGLSLATKICNNYMALGARGVSILFSSGDGGVRVNADIFCDDNTFLVQFPATCPYSTAVGSTIGFSPEVAVNFTSGGFSSFFSTPAYQAAAVSTFFETGIPAGFPGIFNASGRGYPDVSLQGLNFATVTSGQTEPVSGTSASSPTFAAMIALINDQLLAAGKPVLGFLNPLLYSDKAKAAFNDITIGHNQGLICPPNSTAFDAAVGWDPLSGVGTPIYSKLLEAALN